MQPRVWAGGRSATLLPVNRCLSWLAFRHRVFSLVHACLVIYLFRTPLSYYTYVSPHPLFLASSPYYFMALYYIRRIKGT